MVKVQKPEAKTLRKNVKNEGVTKEKGIVKNNAKKTSKKIDTSRVHVADVQEKDSVKPKGKISEKKKTLSIEATTKKAETLKKSKPKRKPLVLAPPTSPVTVAPRAIKKDGKVSEPVSVAASKRSKRLKHDENEVKLTIKSAVNQKQKEKKENEGETLSGKLTANGITKPSKLTIKSAVNQKQKEKKENGGETLSGKLTANGISKPSKLTIKSAVNKKNKEKKENEGETLSGKLTANGISKPSKLTIKSAVNKKNKEKKENEGETLSGKLTANGISKPSKLQKLPKPQKREKPSKKLLEKAKLKLANKKVSLASIKKNKQKTKRSPKVVALKYEIKPFDEDKFNEIVCESNVQKVCSALINQVSEEVKKAKAKTIFSDYRYILQICCYKIPSCPKRVVKLALKHSLVGVEDDVALIVTDLQRGARFDYEPTVQHYEDMLREAGVKQRLTVVPFNRLRNDMGTFEAKRKFLNSYDYLLCDGRISGQASAFLGNYTQKPRNVLHAVRLSKENHLAKEISRGLCRTAYRQLRKGDLTAIPVGNHEHSGQQLTENVLCVIQQLQQQYPGGLANIRSIYLKIDIVGTSAIPLYISMCAPPAEAPYVVGTREQRMLKLKKQANEVLTRFALTKDVDFVKLTHDQVERKAELRKKRLALDDENDEVLVRGSDDAVVPPKKARKNAVKKERGNNFEAKGVADEEDSDDDDKEN